MSNDYSAEEIQSAKKLLSEMDYILALRKFLKHNETMSHKKADLLLKKIQEGEI